MSVILNYFYGGRLASVFIIENEAVVSTYLEGDIIPEETKDLICQKLEFSQSGTDWDL